MSKAPRGNGPRRRGGSEKEKHSENGTMRESQTRGVIFISHSGCFGGGWCVFLWCVGFWGWFGFVGGVCWLNGRESGLKLNISDEKKRVRYGRDVC